MGRRLVVGAGAKAVATWPELRQRFVRLMRSGSTERWRDAQRLRPLLSHFGTDPEALVAHMNRSGGDLDEKDRILAALVELRAGAITSELANALLWLSLWPGLDHIHRRRREFHGDDPDELVSLISAAFTEAVAALNLARVKKVAATLVMNTERRVVDAVLCPPEEPYATRQTRADRAREVSQALEVVEGRAVLAPTSGREVEKDVRQLFNQLGRLDGALLFGRHVLGLTARELGARYRMTPTVVRKRLERIRKRVDWDGFRDGLKGRP